MGRRRRECHAQFGLRLWRRLQEGLRLWRRLQDGLRRWLQGWLQDGLRWWLQGWLQDGLRRWLHETAIRLRRRRIQVLQELLRIANAERTRTSKRETGGSNCSNQEKGREQAIGIRSLSYNPSSPRGVVSLDLIRLSCIGRK